MQKSYLAVGPDAVLTSRKPSDYSATQSIAPTPRRRSYMDPASPRKARGQDSNVPHALPAVLTPKQPPAASSAAAPGHVSTRALPGSPKAVPGTTPAGEAGKKPGSPKTGPRTVPASPGAVPAGAQGTSGAAAAGDAPKKKRVAIAAEAADKDSNAGGGLPGLEGTSGTETNTQSQASAGKL